MITNMTLANTTFLSLFPSGDYITVLKYFDSLDDNIATLNYSSNKYLLKPQIVSKLFEKIIRISKGKIKKSLRSSDAQTIGSK